MFCRCVNCTPEQAARPQLHPRALKLLGLLEAMTTMELVAAASISDLEFFIFH